MNPYLVMGVALFLVVLRSIVSNLLLMRELRLFDQAMDRCSKAGELFYAWQEARPFLLAGQSPYAQGLVLEILGQYLLACKIGKYRPNEKWLAGWRAKLDEQPPHQDPPTSEPRHRGFFY